MPPRCLNIRCLTILAPITLVLVLVVWTYYSYRPPYELYDELFQSEVADSHRVVLEAKPQKYVKFKQLQGAGFNNQAQEILLFHHLALESGRTYVYQPFIWRPRGEKAKVPLSAFLRGPTRGSINEAAFDQVCPESERKHVKLRVNYDKQWKHAKEVLSGPEKCIVVDDWLFSWAYLASAAIHELWPSYSRYLGNHFEWSPQVLNVVKRTQTNLGLEANGSYMAVHLRRGDFEGHCNWLRHQRTGFTTWATLDLVSKSVLPPSLDIEDPESVYEHCYPDLRRILSAITLQAKDRPEMRRIHFLHDGAWDHPLVYHQFYKLKEALMNAEWAEREGWKGGPMVQVTQSSDIPVGRGENDWKVCVDMELAVKARAFVSNGYSSLSSQIIALRLALQGGSESDVTLV